MENNKLDWFGAVVLNPTKDYAHFTVAGYDDTNVKLASAEEYKKSEHVQKMIYWWFRKI